MGWFRGARGRRTPEGVTSGDLALLRRIVDRAASPVADSVVIVMTTDKDPGWARPLAARLSPASVHLVDAGDSTEQAVRALKEAPRPDLLVDATSGRGRFALFRATAWATAGGGTYVALHAGWSWTLRARRAATAPRDAPAPAQRRHQELLGSMGDSARRDGARLVAKVHDHHAIVRHDEVEQVLSARYGPGWGEVLARRSPRQFTSRATIVMHGDPPAVTRPPTIAVPELSLRAYHQVTCRLREIVTRDQLVLPDTYRHWQNTHLFHKRIVPASVSFGRLTDEVAGAPTRHESGTFFSLDSAFPTHFGHLMTETLSRVWGYRLAREQHPDLRIVMTHQPGKPALPRWKHDVLAALDIPTDDILWVREGQPVEVGTLVAAMPQLVNPGYVDPGITDTWQQLVAGIGPDPSPGDRTEKIFVSRGRRSQRACSNAAEVEDFFVAQGFAVVVPEDLSFADQVHVFRRARVIAGFAGSGLFTALVNPAARLIVLASQSYVAANEYLIASANGNELHYFWAPAAIAHPTSGFSVEAYRSAFEFPLHQHRAALLSAVA